MLTLPFAPEPTRALCAGAQTSMEKPNMEGKHQTKTDYPPSFPIRPSAAGAPHVLEGTTCSETLFCLSYVWGAHRALCPRCAKRRLFWTRSPPMAKGTAVTTEFPDAGRLRFLLSPKTQIMSQHN